MADILVIDDDADIAALLHDALTAAGHRVRAVGNGEAGLVAAREAPPDLVLLDWMMPERSGLEVCHLLRAEPAFDRVPVMLLTARGSEADVEWGFAAGADSYVVKPFSPRALVWRVDEVLAKGR